MIGRLSLACLCLLAIEQGVHADPEVKVPVVTGSKPPNELFSESAAELSNATLGLSIVTPLAVQVGGGFDEDMGSRVLIFTEAVGGSILLDLIAKNLVRRPRPYTYYKDPRIMAYAKREGRDATLSFYSGHSSTAFAAAVAGSLLYRNTDTTARAVVWGFEIALASATANLRVRAGRHFYSDVITGMFMGTAFGVFLPALQGKAIAPSALEWGAIGGGAVAGILISQFWPVGYDIKEMVVPLALKDGAGAMVVGRF